jgi:hypothetical protein
MYIYIYVCVYIHILLHANLRLGVPLFVIFTRAAREPAHNNGCSCLPPPLPQGKLWTAQHYTVTSTVPLVVSSVQNCSEFLILFPSKLQ